MSIMLHVTLPALSSATFARAHVLVGVLMHVLVVVLTGNRSAHVSTSAPVGNGEQLCLVLATGAHVLIGVLVHI